MIAKIVLGTAQFGTDYGINNKRGRIPKNEIFIILNEAFNQKVEMLDTAYSYGKSEVVIGEFMDIYKKPFKIIDKLPKCMSNEVKNIFSLSLERLRISQLYGYLIHDFSSYKNQPDIFCILEEFKRERKIQKIGFSLYFPAELELLLEKNIRFDILQIPYNIFDHRFEPYFVELKNRNVELHVRSIFLQGLVFKELESLNEFFEPIKYKLKRLKLLSESFNISLLHICLNFVLQNNLIDKVVVGIDNIEHFQEIVKCVNSDSFDNNISEEFKNFAIDDEKILVPINWEK